MKLTLLRNLRTPALIAAICVLNCAAQAPPPPNQPPGAATQPPPGAAGQTPGAATPKPAGPDTSQPITMDLAGALQRARDYNQLFLTAGIATALAHEDRVQARAAMFPSVNAFNQYIYTQGNGTPSGVFVANDGVHIYNEQAVVHAELFSVTRRAEYNRTIAAEAVARAKQEVAARGLIATVVQNYYGLITAQRHEANARRSLEEARRFLDLTQKQERGGEVSRADVIKAQLQVQQRERDLMDAVSNTQRARIALGVILFSDFAQAYDITDDLRPDAPLPPIDELRALMLNSSPELRAAKAGQVQAAAAVSVARGAYIPALVVDYFFGIDNNEFATKDREGRNRLGSVVQGTVTIPVWNWGALQSKVRQARLQQKQADLELTFAQRNALSTLTLAYLDAQTARSQLESLRSSLDLSIESLRLTVLRYQAGEATALEVVDAQTTLSLARNASDDGLARYRVALAVLQTLTGRF